MRRFLMIAVCLYLISLLPASCRHETYSAATGNSSAELPADAGACSPDSVYFVNTVLPVLVSNCAMAGCHDQASHREGLNLTSYQGVMRIVRAGNANASELTAVIRASNWGGRMPPPPMPALASDQINTITKWINQGALNNYCQSCDSASNSFSSAVQPIFRTYCIGCHSPGNLNGGIDLSSYTAARSVVLGGRLMGAINQLPGYVAMPQGGYKLSACQIAQIQHWIDAGYQNN